MKNLTTILKQIEKSKSIIAKERDKLREIESELETFLDTVNTGMESLDIAVEEFKSAIDTFSQQV